MCVCVSVCVCLCAKMHTNHLNWYNYNKSLFNRVLFVDSGKTHGLPLLFSDDVICSLKNFCIIAFSMRLST